MAKQMHRYVAFLLLLVVHSVSCRDLRRSVRSVFDDSEIKEADYLRLSVPEAPFSVDSPFIAEAFHYPQIDGDSFIVKETAEPSLDVRTFPANEEVSESTTTTTTTVKPTFKKKKQHHFFKLGLKFESNAKPYGVKIYNDIKQLEQDVDRL